ncbi:PLP-dependent aminotransferase family protein [Herbiconiux sp. CPCC 205763]|uniref:PLP-dependent aminotransferase family protein n=1 Tax=Herbiconiux aconitum TaxID=2970913 RepID=A0ABT2GSK5_9MICO|nr:PLP-dependent aminotransferase family protein [Herbiconiux aconitum]MCS5719106.1 PLP-dependent aminotransferase family protein [Herbiconiux aconitum]
MAEDQTNSSTGSLAGFGVDLHLDLNGTRLGAGLTAALREAVRSGRLTPGTRLPASRALAADLGIARSTVTECYAELVAEGWLTARQGSGTRVAQLATPRPAAGGGATATGGAAAPAQRRSTGGLSPGAGEFAEFPRVQWLAAARRALAAAPPSAFGYGDPLGRMELREALADYLSRVRGVRAEPDQIVICAGFHHGLMLVAQALRSRGARAVAVESYGLALYRDLLTDAGLSIPPIAVDDSGARTDELEQLSGVDAVLLTAAHQFPIGFALSPERRAAARDWARVTGGWILEDDYDGEFRYDRKPVGAVQGLDPERVVYFGTASKSLGPALRVGWMVLPQSLLPDVVAAKGRVEVVSVIEQLTLAEFITSGAFDRHVRSRRQINRRRREQLIDALAANAPGIRVIGMAAGLQAVLVLPPGTENAVRDAAARHGLLVSGLAEFRHPAFDSPPVVRDGLVVNFSALSDAAWERALAILCSVLPH